MMLEGLLEFKAAKRSCSCLAESLKSGLLGLISEMAAMRDLLFPLVPKEEEESRKRFGSKMVLCTPMSGRAMMTLVDEVPTLL